MIPRFPEGFDPQISQMNADFQKTKREPQTYAIMPDYKEANATSKHRADNVRKSRQAADKIEGA
jgi:hypothetical protein